MPRATLDEASLELLTAKIDKKLKSKGPDKKPKEKNKKRKREEPPQQENPKKKRVSDKGGGLSKDDLLNEIKALGGDEADLALVDGVESGEDETFQANGAK